MPLPPRFARDVLDSSLRSGTSRAKRYAVGNANGHRHGNGLPILAASPLARSAMPTVFGDVLPPRTSRASLRRLSRAVLKDPAPFHAQPWSVMPTVIPRFLQTPRWHACCEDKEQQSRQRPQWCRCRDLDLLVPVGLPASPA